MPARYGARVGGHECDTSRLAPWPPGRALRSSGLSVPAPHVSGKSRRTTTRRRVQADSPAGQPVLVMLSKMKYDKCGLPGHKTQSDTHRLCRPFPFDLHLSLR
jgi:hypothetical protein